MIVASITELSIVGVFDRGAANNERIVIRANNQTDMGQFGLVLGIRTENNAAAPINDCFFWFGNGFVQPGDLIFVYTGPGSPVTSSLPDGRTKTYSMHWGRETTVLQNLEVVPMLLRTDAVNVFEDIPRLPTS